MEELLDKMKRYYPAEFDGFLREAYEFAKNAHAGQKRASGEDYFTHPVAVAHIIVDLGLDAHAVAASLLHDVVEDTPVTEEEVIAKFGKETAELVEGVTKLDKLEFKSKEEEQAENFRKLFFAMAKDVRVILIKLADRLHNMRSLGFLSPERQQAMARETMDIYAPLAGRLGISSIKCELEDLCFKYLNPEDYHKLAEAVALKKSERQAVVEQVVKEIKELLVELDIHGEVTGRPKHLYSIYKKIKKQNKNFDQIYDLIAVRVIVDNINDCYNVFGEIHRKWKPIPGRIKDYIATPKPNMYQSLHTTVITNYGQPFEIQIRTFEMHRIAEYGIAAHWKYKEGRTESSSLDERLSWIREVMEWQGDLKDAKEFLSSLKEEVFADEVLVFTPKGDVISLTNGATPIDFAYHIHSQIGNKCVGAKVNSKMVPLGTELKNGDVVEVMTSTAAKGPSWDWLKIVKTPGARNKIRQFFKKEMKEENIKRGKSMLESEAKRKGYQLKALLSTSALDAILQRNSFQSVDEVYAAIGYGAFTTNQILLKLIDNYNSEQRLKAPEQVVTHTGPGKNKSHNIIVKGHTDLLVRFAGCCNPVPGDQIIGYISRGRGVSIHRADCSNMRNAEEERLIEAEWGRSVESERYTASVQIEAIDSEGLLAKVTNIVSAINLSIYAINARLNKSGKAIVDLTVSISKSKELDDLIKKLGGLAEVEKIYRK